MNPLKKILSSLWSDKTALILMVLIVVLITGSCFIVSALHGHADKDSQEVKQVLDGLQKSAEQGRSRDRAALDSLKAEATKIAQERRELSRTIGELEDQKTKTKLEYEKINRLDTLPVDSIIHLFAKRP